MIDALVNVDAEIELLGAVLCENALLDRVADVIGDDDFSEPLHQQIYDAALREVSLGKTANAISLRGYFADENTPAYLMRLTAAFMGASVIDTAKLIRDLATRRKMRAGLSVASTACADLTVTNAEIISHADAALEGNAKDTIHQPTAAECFDELIEGFRDKSLGVSSGRVEALDKVLGPLRPKQLVIGAGRPGMGKTAVALSYSIGAAMAGHGVLFVSLEMSSRELAARMAADMAFDHQPIPFAAIRDGNLNQAQEELIRDAGNHLRKLPFQVVDAGNLAVGRLSMLIRRHARRMAANGHKLELVVVDYLQLLSPDVRGRSNYEAVSEVSRALKAMAKDNGVAIMALAQLSREVEKRPDRKPQLSDLRDSGQIEQDADAVFFLMRPEYYLRQDEPDAMDPKRGQWEQALADVKGRIDFIVAKRRNGTTGMASGEFHGQYQAVR